MRAVIKYASDYPRTNRNRAPVPAPSHKILVVIPFWSGDRAAASRLIRLLTDLEDAHSEWADVALVARFDCKHDPRDVELISRRFNTHVVTSKRRGTGWPMGCSELAFGAIEWFAGSMTKGAIPKYKAMLIHEADTCPLVKNWVELVNRAWDVAEKSGAVVAGAMVGGGEFGRRHINGGAIMLSGKPDFMKRMLGVSSRYSVNAGWDWALASFFEEQGWAAIPSFLSYWQRPTMGLSEVEALRAAGVVLLHGVKDDSLVRHVRKLLIG